MLSTITLDRDATCHKCGATLTSGRRARIGYGRIYCPTNAHGGALTKAERNSQAVRIQMAERQIHWDRAHGHITNDEADRRLSALRG